MYCNVMYCIATCCLHHQLGSAGVLGLCLCLSVGSLTLLKWKLLATPHLGGAASFFSPASRPGIHVKGWKSSGVVDDSSHNTSSISDTASTPPRSHGSTANSSFSVQDIPRPRGSSSPLRNASKFSKKSVGRGGQGLTDLLVEDTPHMNRELTSRSSSSSRLRMSSSPHLSRGSKSPKTQGMSGVGLASLLDEDVD